MKSKRREFVKVVHNQVSRGKFVRSVACGANRDAFHARTVRSRDAGRRIFDDDAGGGRKLQSTRCLQKDSGVGLAVFDALAGDNCGERIRWCDPSKHEVDVDLGGARTDRKSPRLRMERIEQCVRSCHDWEALGDKFSKGRFLHVSDRRSSLRVGCRSAGFLEERTNDWRVWPTEEAEEKLASDWDADCLTRRAPRELVALA